MNRWRTTFLLLLAGLGLGCFGKTPVHRVWSLQAEDDAVVTTRTAPSLGLAHFTSDAPLRTTKLTWREGDGRELRQYGYHSWSDYPDRMLEELTRRSFEASGDFSRVDVLPPAQGHDAILRCRLVRFHESQRADAHEVQVSVRWRLTTPGGTPIDSDRTDATAPVKAGNVEAVIDAYDEATHALVTKLREQVLASLAKAKSES
ncbi:MAG: ABC-type transport auxiliary lipoprotein family protein [Acidobacteriota bacterium]